MTLLFLCGSVLLAASACRSGAPEPPPPAYAPTATIKDLMLGIVDPSADAVWLSVTSVMSKDGTVDTAPRNDEDWARVRHGAVALIEAGNLLMMPGRSVARPGETSETPGVELEPAEMDALIARDRAAWNIRAKALQTASTQVLQAIEAKDANKVFELGADIETACENCHRQYWYPNEKLPYEQPAAP